MAKQLNSITEEPIISILNLQFKYLGNDYSTLKDININFNRGEFIVLTGKSGCGKSTLALCLAGFIPNSIPGELQGKVLVAGNDVKELSPGKLAGVVGLVQQDPEAQLCTLNVLDEVAFGPENLCLPREEIRTRVEWALGVVDAIDLIDRDVYSLSGGEKQRVAIASVLAMKPAVIILDEPTANLDPKGTMEVLAAIKKLRDELNTTVIVIEHRLKKVLPMADRLIKMDQGQIVLDEKLLNFTDIKEVDNNQKPLSHKPQANNKEKDQGLLRVENITVAYGEKVVLNNVSFQLYPSDVVAVMGNNGSGKTTLLLSLLGINKLVQGSIFLNNKNITTDKVSKRAVKMGLVFQNPNHQIFENTVIKEATLAASYLTQSSIEDRQAKAQKLLQQFELIEYAHKLPFALSMGEKKRLTLASVLTYKPEILLLDEPLVGQDSARLALFTEALQEHSEKGGVTLMICHEPSFVKKYCNRVLFLHNGQLLSDGSVEEAFEKIQQLGLTEYID